LPAGINGNELIIRCRELHDIGRQVSATLLELLKNIEGKQKIYTFKHRVKPSKAIWNKVHRNRNEARKLREQQKNLSPEDDAARAELDRKISEAECFGPDDVFDSFGCRYVTLFEEQRLALICDLFNALNGFSPAAAGDVPVKLTNCSIYYAPTASGAEDRAVELVETLRKRDFVPRVIPDRNVIKEPIPRTGYSSVHFNFELPVIVDFPRGDHPLAGQSEPQVERARFEVQVRDVFEEAWSEAEHYLFYSQKDDFRELTDQQAEKIREAKDLVDAYRANIDTARIYISMIKKLLDRARSPAAPDLTMRSTTTRIDDRSAIEAALQGKVAPETVETLREAYALMSAAENNAAENTGAGDDAAQNYAEAAERLTRVRASLGQALNLPVSNRFNRPVKYFVETELANSLSFSQQPDNAELARKLYSELIKEYPNDPSLRYRYGRALLLRGLNDEQTVEVLELMTDMRSLVEKDELTGPNHWLPLTAATLQGYAHGKLAEKYLSERRFKEAQKEFEAAVVSTRQGVSYWRGLPANLREQEIYKHSAFKAASNIIYYLAYLIYSGGGGKPKFDRQAVRDQIDEIDGIKIRIFRDFYKSLDNKMRGLVVIEEYEEAVKLAKEIYETLRAFADSRAGRPVQFHEVGNFLNVHEQKDLNAAVNVVISEGRRWT
jgi:ppGpp synthetase/RelA/SpoT-type nucleotidyltranferase